MQRLAFLLGLSFPLFFSQISLDMTHPLQVDEVINCIKNRWQVSYDIRLVVRLETLYLQAMWAYLEQKSFPLDEEGYRLRVAEAIEVVNRLGLASEVRKWLLNVNKRPRVGKALSFKLEANDSFKEFFL